MRTWGFNIFAFICIVVASKEVTQRLVDRYVYEGEEKVNDGPRFFDRTKKGQVFKTSVEIDSELVSAKKITPAELKLRSYFS